MELKILYELTYATRGNSGIPRDTLALAQILQGRPASQTDFLLNPRAFTVRGRIQPKSSQWASVDLGNALRKEPGRSVLPKLIQTSLLFLQSLSAFRAVVPFAISERLQDEAFRYLGFPQKISGLGNASGSNIFLIPLSYAARFLRPSFLRPFKLKVKDIDIFIQQQVDPIDVSSSVTHIIRLHDFLPISYPQYFDDMSVKVFSKSLRIMLKGNKKIWVMDSLASATEFKKYFGSEIDVRVIPCAVTMGDKSFESRVKKKQILVLNTIEPRKRVMLAIAGFKMAKEQGIVDPDWDLVIAGSEGWQEKDLVAKLREGKFGHDIIFSESPTDFEVKTLLSESQIILSTSAAEGFGLPPLEGMSFGCIPVVSDIPQHHETLKEHGIYFEGSRPDSVSKALGIALQKAQSQDLVLQENLQAHVDRYFSFESISTQWNELLEGLPLEK